MKKTFKVALGALTATLVLTSCGPAGDPGAGEDAGSGGSAGSSELTVWIAGNSTAEERTAILEMLGEIDEVHDDFTLKVVEQTDLPNQLQAAMISNDLPDITMSDSNRLGVFVHPGMFLPVDDLISPEILDDMLPSVLAATTYDVDGKMYNVGQIEAGMALWANKSMLEGVGARIPTSYKEAWTKEEFEKILADLKEAGHWPLDIGQSDPAGGSLYYTYLPVVASFGGDWMDRETMLAEGKLNSPETVEAAEYLEWLAEQGYVDMTTDNDDGYYGRKDTAMQLFGHWIAPQATENLGDDAILVPIPDFGHGVYSASGSSTWGITKQAETNGTVDEAAQVLNDLLSAENVGKISQANGSIPSRLSVLNEDPRFAEGERFYLFREQLEAGIAINRPQTPAAVFARAEIGETLMQIMSFGDAEEAMEAATAEIDQLIEDNQYAAE